MKNENMSVKQFIKNYEGCTFYDHLAGEACPMTAEDILNHLPLEVSENMMDEKILFAYKGGEEIRSWTVMELAQEIGETVEIID